MGKQIKRRQSHGSAWHWKQTDCWYYTLSGTGNRVPLFYESGARIRGRENQQAAEVALAREKLTWATAPGTPPGSLAQASTIRHRSANACPDFAHRAQRMSCSRSSSETSNFANGRPMLNSSVGTVRCVRRNNSQEFQRAQKYLNEFTNQDTRVEAVSKPLKYDK